MSMQRELAEKFASYHIKGDPLILFNGWDAGSAKILEEVGAKAVATGSWSVGMSHGNGDAESVPLKSVIANLERITDAVDLPVTLDFEGGYSVDVEPLKENISRVIDAGAIGINFEDQVIGVSDQIHSVEVQSARIAAIRQAAEAKNVPLFINARTDVFLKSERDAHASWMDDAIARAHAYKDAGASGFFTPGLCDPELIRRMCDASPLPINIMIMPDAPKPKELAALGVSRISYGGGPYMLAMERFRKSAVKALASVDG